MGASSGNLYGVCMNGQVQGTMFAPCKLHRKDKDWVQMRTTEAARECNVTLNTIRNWCKDYGAFLSPGATVASGQREFTPHDIEILRYIALLRSEGMQKGAIVQRLGETVFPEIEPGDQVDTALDAHPASPEGPGAAQLPAPVQNDLALRLDRLERSLVEVQGAARPNWWWWVFGVVCGLAMAGLAELAALVASRGR